MKALIWSLAGLLGMVGAPLAEMTPEVEVPRLERPIRAIIPNHILHLNLRDYFADFILRIGTEGQVIDSICIEASHPGLIQRGREELSKGRYQPGRENGTPFIADMMVRVHFYHPSLEMSGAVIQSGLDHIERTFSDVEVDPFKFRLTAPQDLDKPLALLERGKTYVPTNEQNQPVYGSTLIEFYVDREGIPRMPKILRSDHEAISEAALNNLSSWRFNRPTANRKPTVVKARMPFDFTE